MITLQLINIFPNEDIGGYEVDVRCLIDNEVCEVTLYIQTCDYLYKPQMGCLILGENGEKLTTKEELVLKAFDIVDEVENQSIKDHEDRYIYHHVRCQLYVREDTHGDRYSIITINNDVNRYEYGNKYGQPYGDFKNLGEGIAFVNEHSDEELYGAMQ